VYVRKVNDTDGPYKTLKGFQRVGIAAGKTGQATIGLPPTAFEYFDRAQGKMSITAGEYEVMYGNSSDTKDLKMAKVTIQ
jgi:beta-glucosidase